MVYFDNLLPRDDIPIQNMYEIFNTNNTDIHFVCYYLEEKKCRLILRRLDNPTGWSNNLVLKIMSIDGLSHENIVIGSSEENYKIYVYETELSIYPIVFRDQSIPKVIVQTTFDKNIENILHINSIMTFIELNPEYEYQIFDDKESRIFIKKHFSSSILVAYDLLIAGSFKSDLFRYCYLYINGGCYFDCKQILKTPLRNMIHPNDKFLLCKDIGQGYFNAMILTEKNDFRLLKSIELCQKKILNFDKYYDFKTHYHREQSKMLTLTGPDLMGECIYKDVAQHNIKFYHKIVKNRDNYKRLVITYNEKIIIYKCFAGYSHTGDYHYSTLWREGIVLYTNPIIKENYKFYIYAHKFPDTFNIDLLDSRTIKMERTDQNTGWGNNFKIKMIDESKDITYLVESGSSDNKYKEIYIKNI